MNKIASTRMDTHCLKWPSTLKLLRGERQALGALYLLSAIVSVTGNSLIIAAILKSTCLRKLTNMPLLNLCFADLIVGCLANPLGAFVLWYEFYAKGTCQLNLTVAFIACFSCVASILLLTLLSLDRYIKIVHFVRYSKWVTRKRLFFSITVCWIFAFISGHLFISRIKSIYTNTFLFGIALFCFSLVIIFYFMIFKRVRSRSATVQLRRSVPAWNPTSQENQQKQRDMRFHVQIAKNLLVIIVTFVCVWTPFVTVLMFRYFLSPELGGLYTSLYHWFLWLGFANSSLNPIIHNMKNRTIQKQIYKMLGIRQSEDTTKPSSA